MNKRIKVNIFAIAVILLLSYFEIGVIRSVFFPNRVVLMGALFIACMIFFSKMKDKRLSKYEISWILAITLLVVARNQYLAIGEFDNNIVYYYLLCAIIVFTKKQTRWINYFIEYMFWISLMHAIATIVFSLNGHLYVNFMSAFLSGDVLQSNLKHYNSGTIAGLCSNYGVNASILSIGSGIAIIRLLWGEKKDRRKYVLHSMIRLTALLFTGKRAQVIMIVVAFLLLYIFIEKRGSEKKLIKFVLVGGLFIVLFALATPFIPQFQVLSNRLLDTDDWNTLGGRTELYKLAFVMIKRNPLFGNGWNSYKLMAENTIGRKYLSQFARLQTHNIYLQMMSEVGIIGTVWITYMFWIPIKNGFNICRLYGLKNLKAYIGKENVEGLVSSLFILLFFMLYGLTGNPLYDAYIYFLAFLSCAAIQSIKTLIVENKMDSSFVDPKN